MSIPNTNTFTLSEVCGYFGLMGASRSLVNCFTSASSGYDPLYEGNRDSLLNFRNYGAWSVSSMVLMGANTNVNVNLGTQTVSTTPLVSSPGSIASFIRYSENRVYDATFSIPHIMGGSLLPRSSSATTTNLKVMRMSWNGSILYMLSNISVMSSNLSTSWYASSKSLTNTQHALGMIGFAVATSFEFSSDGLTIYILYSNSGTPTMAKKTLTVPWNLATSGATSTLYTLATMPQSMCRITLGSDDLLLLFTSSSVTAVYANTGVVQSTTSMVVGTFAMVSSSGNDYIYYLNKMGVNWTLRQIKVNMP